MMKKIWDAHSHWMPPEIAANTTFFRKGWSDINALLNTLDNSGIEKAVLLYPNCDAHLKLGGWSRVCDIYNAEIAAKVKEYPQRLIGSAILPVDQPQDMLREMERIKELGLSCLSLASSYDGSYLDERSFLPVFEKAAQERLPVFVHPQIINPIGFERIKDPLLMPVVEYPFDLTISAGKLMLAGILRKFKHLKVVFAHFAGVLPFLGDRFDSTYLMLRSRNIVQDLPELPSVSFKNIFVDTSGVKSSAMLNLALEFFGPTKIIWGSDFPAQKEPLPSLDMLNSLNIAETAKEDISFANLMHLFKQGD